MNPTTFLSRGKRFLFPLSVTIIWLNAASVSTNTKAAISIVCADMFSVRRMFYESKGAQFVSRDELFYFKIIYIEKAIWLWIRLWKQIREQFAAIQRYLYYK